MPTSTTLLKKYSTTVERNLYCFCAVASRKTREPNVYYRKPNASEYYTLLGMSTAARSPARYQPSRERMVIAVNLGISYRRPLTKAFILSQAQ